MESLNRSTFAAVASGFVLLLALASTAQAERGQCGQPHSHGVGPKTTDALHVLRVAVGHAGCVIDEGEDEQRATLAGSDDDDSCVTNDDCDDDELCLEGECEDDDSCTTDEDCDDDEACLEGECEDDDSCTTDEDCDDDEACLEGECEDDDSCTTDEDCDDDELCLEGECEDDDSCTTDANCDDDELCEEGECEDTGKDCACDVNDDGNVGANDALRVLLKAVGSSQGLHCGWQCTAPTTTTTIAP